MYSIQFNLDIFQCDQPKEGIANNMVKMNEFCQEKGFTAWFETSAKENINIDEAAKALVNKVNSFRINNTSIQNKKFKASLIFIFKLN